MARTRSRVEDPDDRVVCGRRGCAVRSVRGDQTPAARPRGRARVSVGGRHLTGTPTRSSDPSIGTLIARARTSDRARGTGVDRDRPIRGLLADDSYLIREALQEVLGPLDAVDLIGSYADG